MWVFDKFGNRVWSEIKNPRLARMMGKVNFNSDGDGGGASNPPPADTGNADPEALKKQLADLQAENERYKQKHSEAEKHRKEQERLAREASEKAAKAAGDMEAYEKSWNEKHSGALSERDEVINSQRGMIEELTVGQTASEICNKIAMEGCAPALMPHVRSRLKSEIVDGRPVTKVLDANGKISALTIDDLLKELKTVPYLAPLIIGSKASGGGNPGSQGSSNNGKLKTREQVEKLNPFEKADYFKQSGGKYAD